MKIKKTEITVESFEVLVIRQRGSLARGQCSTCGRQVVLISLDDACLSGLSEEAIRRQADNGRLHFTESSGRSLLICLNSLIQN